MKNHSPSPNISLPHTKPLGVVELVAIALGGMVGGGIFTVLGIAVSLVGVFTPVAIALGGIVAGFAAYSYIKLGVYYKDEGATYSFYKKTFPKTPFAASLIGWWVIFGYISTLALYAYTFASYSISGFSFADNLWIRKGVAGGVIAVFTLINIWSVKGMGRIEDLMVYTKLFVLTIISVLLIRNGNATLPHLLEQTPPTTFFNILIVSSLTFVAYEGFQLVINAVNEMENPDRNIPRAIYTAIALAILIYVVISLGAILAIPFPDIIRDKEYALAAGARDILGAWGMNLVIFGALLATSSAISGTIFGASRQMAVIAEDGYFPAILARRRHHIPIYAILTMSGFAFSLILIGNLQVILEFGSVTFLLVSLLMAYANFRIRDKTQSAILPTILSIITLTGGTVLILYYEFTTHIEQLYFIAAIYVVLTVSAWGFGRRRQTYTAR